MRCCLRTTVYDTVALLRRAVAVETNGLKSGRKIDRRGNLLFPAFSPFSQKKGFLRQSCKHFFLTSAVYF